MGSIVLDSPLSTGSAGGYGGGSIGSGSTSFPPQTVAPPTSVAPPAGSIGYPPSPSAGSVGQPPVTVAPPAGSAGSIYPPTVAPPSGSTGPVTQPTISPTTVGSVGSVNPPPTGSAGSVNPGGSTGGLPTSIGSIGSDSVGSVAPSTGSAGSTGSVMLASAGGSVSPTSPQTLTNDQGQTITGPNGQPIKFPAGLDPHFFVKQGQQDGQIEQQLITGGTEGGPFAALGYEAGALSKFKQGGAWDAQRVGGTFHPEYVDYATVAIGLYGAASGIPESDILNVQNTYAGLFSHYPPGTVMDSTYTHLPARNVANTNLGYQLYNSGQIGPGH